MKPRTLWSLPARAWLVAASLGALLASAGCSTFVKPELPGETDYTVTEVRYDPPVTLALGELPTKLSVRSDTLLIPGMPYNPYRVAEDRRRLRAYWQTFGHFDVDVPRAAVDLDEDKRTAVVTWAITEGPRYTIRDVDVSGADPDQEQLVRARIPFARGAPVDIETYRRLRHAMVDDLRRAGWVHAEVYSRTFVDRAAKVVDWVYFVDAGPRTVVGRVSVAGNAKIPADDILDRLGLEPGQPLSTARLEKLEVDLLDTGAFNTARILSSADITFPLTQRPPDTELPPDTGGKIPSDRVDASGNLIPRSLQQEIDLTVQVVESPNAQATAGFGAYIDLERVDPFATAGLTVRNAFGPLHHLVVEGNVGYGIQWRSDDDLPEGPYGSVLLRTVHPGVFGRLGDLRSTFRFTEQLFPGFHWRTAVAGLGVRVHAAHKLFIDIEPRFRADWPVDVGVISDADRDRVGLAPVERTLNGELLASLIWDARDDGFEPLDGHLIAVNLGYAPPVGDQHWLKAELDLRWIINLNQNMALALRGAAGWVTDLDDGGVPLGARLFGGGPWGVRAFSEKQLTSYATACESPTECRNRAVGASSLVQSAVELRWLPFRKQFGAVAFVDVGGAGDAANPFEDGVSVAPGLGLRVRTWHIPLAIDFSYRVTDVGRYSSLNRFFVFARVGESF